MTAVLQELLGLIVGGITTVAQAIGSGASEMVTSAFLTVNSETGAVTGLSAFGGVLAIFAGVSLAIAFTTKIFLWISSLGARN